MSAVSENPLDAADPRRSAWVSANAGAGKTYTLANRVSRLLLEGARPERILCLTYTKAAAAEMAGRLFDQLGKWAMLDDDALHERILEIGAGGRDEEGLRHARRLFATALETPGGLKIQTIHSFCQNLLSRFPLEAGVPPSFEVLDEQTARELGRVARSRILERAGQGDERLAKAVSDIVTFSDETKLEAVLVTSLGNERRKFERFVERHGGDAGAISASILAAHGVNADDTPESAAENFCAEIRNEGERLAEVVLWLAGGSPSDCELAAALSAAADHGNFDGLRAEMLTQKGKPRDRLVSKATIDANPALHIRLSQYAARFLAAEEKCRAARAAMLADAAIVLARAVHREYAQIKRQHAVLDYDDLVGKTLGLLETHEAAAWVLFKLDGRLDHILIDEGQDTSPEQWRIVQHLAEEFFAGHGRRDDISRTIFVVGDEKQSIFSFQGADPARFEIQRLFFAERAGAPPFDFVTVQLSTSRRSAPEILRFVVEVFADTNTRRGVTSGDAPVSHKAFRETAKGRVEVWPTIKPLAQPEPDLWQRPVDLPPPDSPVVRLARDVAQQIEQWVDGAHRIPGRDRAIQPGDIMVLMPRREPFAGELIRQLKLRGVPVAGADRITLTDQIAVMDLIALGRFALLPEDDLNLATLLRSPLIGISENELIALAAERHGTLWRELTGRENETPSFARAVAILSDCLSRADYSPPFEFYAHVLGAAGTRKLLLARLGVEANDAIDEFLSLALAFEALNPPSLEGFLDWLERGDAEIKRDMDRGRNEVRVMTVHGAKGLEADIVVLPDTTNLPLTPAQRGILLYTEQGIFFPIRADEAPEAVQRARGVIEQENLKEYRRLLYVALTRARDRLCIAGFQGKNKIKPESWYPALDAAARKIGNPEKRGSDTIHVIGSADAEPLVPGAASVSAPLVLPEWTRTALPVEVERPRFIRPSVDAAEAEIVSSAAFEGLSQRERGILAHTLLAYLPDIEAAQRRTVALGYLAKQDIDDASAAEIVDETLGILEHGEFAAVFGPGSRAEVGIVADLPELGESARVNGRMDRLVVLGGNVLAVDYKTGRTVPEKSGEVPRPYLAQMALYRAALAKIFPGKRISCALVWTARPLLMPLPEALLEAEIAEIRARLDPPALHS